jgi:glutamate carboxypeptidase
MRKSVAGVGLSLLSATLAHAAQAVTAKDARVWAAAQEARPEQLKLLEQVVNMDSGTGDVAGSKRVVAVLVSRLMALGMSVETLPAEAPELADNVVARLSGTGKGRILLIGHLDTVFEPGTAAQRPYRTDAFKAYGPGVGDEKGGVVSAIMALQIMKGLGFKDFKNITFLIESSEERGSPGTRGLIAKLLADADVELNLEPGEEPDGVTVWRKGAAAFYIDVKGRAAHAGVAPQDGRNAALELIHQIDGIKDYPKSGDGLTVNLTLMNAGARYNIIPENASAVLNVRVREKTDADELAADLEAHARATIIPDTKVTIRREESFPPLPSNAATDALASRAQAIYAEVGQTLGTGGNGGGSESALANEAGVPALDGLGPAGGGYHSDKEYIHLGTVTPRLYLLTRLIMDLGVNPPARLK